MEVLRILLALLVSYIKCIEANRWDFSSEDVEKLNGSCHDNGTCHASSPTCACKPGCRDNWYIDTGDPLGQDRCCNLETKYFVIPKVIDPIYNYECRNSLYMKGKCSENWRQENVAALCMKATTQLSKHPNNYGSANTNPFPISLVTANAITDPFLITPVTSKTTNITYQNYYCAICHNEFPAELNAWSLKINFKFEGHYSFWSLFDSSFIYENLQSVNGTWGIYKSDFSSHIKNDFERDSFNNLIKEEFIKCTFDPQKPDDNIIFDKWCDESHFDKCSSNWTDTFIEKLCYTYEGIVQYNNKKYRNYYCAICNFIEVHNLTCPLIRIESHFEGQSPFSLSALFDFGFKENLCSVGQIWDPLSKKCWSIFARKSLQSKDNRTISDTTRIDTLNTNKTENSNSTNPYKIEGINNTTCDVAFINETEFHLGPNLTIVVNSSSISYKPDEYEFHEDGILVCIYTDKSESMAWLTLIGLSLSCICLSLHLLAFSIVPDLKNLSGKNLTSLCLALMAAYICFICSSFKDPTSVGCQPLASFMYYFFIASFMWMNVIAFDIWLALHMSTSKFQVISGQQWKKFIGYSVYAWVMPLIALVTVLLIDHFKPRFVSDSFVPELGVKLCWFGQRKAILIYFAIPLAVIMTTNAIFFVMAARSVTIAAKSNTLLATTKPYHLQLKIYLKLALLMGLGWTSGVVAGYAQNEYLWYLFILMNAFQGVYILIAYTCTKKVRRALVIRKKTIAKISIRGRRGNKRLSMEKNISLPSRPTSQSGSNSATSSTLLKSDN